MFRCCKHNPILHLYKSLVHGANLGFILLSILIKLDRKFTKLTITDGTFSKLKSRLHFTYFTSMAIFYYLNFFRQSFNFSVLLIYLHFEHFNIKFLLRIISQISISFSTGFNIFLLSTTEFIYT
jgi:hypothetical protein